MSREEADVIELATRLLDDAFVRRVPWEALLTTGSLPDGWADRYRTFLEQAQAVFAGRPQFPREVVGAVYSTSVYCMKRYHDWQLLTGGRNESTHQMLQRLRWQGDKLLIGWCYGRATACRAGQ